MTPLTLPKQSIKSGTGIQIRAVKEDYAPAEQSFTMDDVLAATKSGSGTLTVNFALTRIHLAAPVLVTSAVDGAQVFIDNQLAGPAPIQQTVAFSRADSNASWNSVEIRIEKPRYLTLTRHLTFDDAAANSSSPQPWKIEFAPSEIERDMSVEFKANIPDATVSINDVPIGTTPLKQTLVFTRTNATQPWSVKTVKIAKEGFEHRPPDKDADPVYVRTLTADDAAVGQVSADYFVPVRFVSVPLRTFTIQNDKLGVQTEKVMAEVSQLEQGRAPTQFTTAKPENPLVVSRISVIPDQPDQIVYTIPKREERPTSANPDDLGEIIGANIWQSGGTSQRPKTFGSQFDIDPFVTADGRWIYFSSDRLRTRCIWRMPVGGGTSLTRITGDFSSIDTEPAVSADESKLAYTSRPVGALPTSPSYIWIANFDGTLPTQTREGQSPAWSPDGKKIAFVSTEKKIWVMDADGGNPTELTQGDWNDCCPIWTPLGKHIIFASDRGLSDIKQHNYDIWMIASDGSGETQLTRNGSYDSSPAISPDGRFLYFFSNRGSQKTGQEALQIYRLDLPGE